MTRAVLRNFKVREREVRVFTETLETLHEIDIFTNPTITGVNFAGEELRMDITEETLQIFRASFYLLLYNLIEATINDVIREFKETITNDSISVDKLSTRTRNIYIDGLIGGKNKETGINAIVKDLIGHTLRNEPIKLEKVNFHVSGNVDYDFIKQVVSSIGCRGRLTVDEEKLSNIMGKVKNCRNNLAHGNTSFVSTGRNQIIQDIKEEFEVVSKYLNEMIVNFVTYLDDKKYL